jgi:hypothetical protein
MASFFSTIKHDLGKVWNAIAKGAKAVENDEPKVAEVAQTAAGIAETFDPALTPVLNAAFTALGALHNAATSTDQTQTQVTAQAGATGGNLVNVQVDSQILTEIEALYQQYKGDFDQIKQAVESAKSGTTGVQAESHSTKEA